jgi:hypothetical protein
LFKNFFLNNGCALFNNFFAFFLKTDRQSQRETDRQTDGQTNRKFLFYNSPLNVITSEQPQAYHTN